MSANAAARGTDPVLLTAMLSRYLPLLPMEVQGCIVYVVAGVARTRALAENPGWALAVFRLNRLKSGNPSGQLPHRD